MKKDYNLIATKIIDLIGGKDNVKSVMRCMTRLRLDLNNFDIATKNKDEIKNTNGIIDVIIQGGQYQICIGADVGKVYEILEKNISTTTTSKSEEEKTEKNSEIPKNNKSKFDNFFGTVAGIFTPMVPVLLGTGMLGALLTILKLSGILSDKSSTYYVLNFIFDSSFYFFPIMIAFNAGKIFNGNPFLAMFLGGILIHPALKDFSHSGLNNLSFWGLNIPNIDYSKSVFPTIITVWLMAYVERFFSKYIPNVLKAFAVPLLTILIVVPLELTLIAPFGVKFSFLISNSINWAITHLGFLPVTIVAAIAPLAILKGVHSLIFPIMLTLLPNLHYDPIIMPSLLSENLAMAGAAVAIGFISKEKSKKREAFSAGSNAIIGISEPAMYGVNIPSKFGFTAAIIGSAFGGTVAGMLKLKLFMLASSSLLGIPAMFSNAGYKNVLAGLLTMIVAFSTAFIATIILSKTYKK